MAANPTQAAIQAANQAANTPNPLNPAHGNLAQLPNNAGGITAVQNGSDTALTYRKTKYDKASSIKLEYLIKHSHLSEYVLRYNGTDIRIGMMDTQSGKEHYAYHDAATGQWFGSFGGLDAVATHLAGQQCRQTWKDFRVIRNSIDVGSMEEFRENWAQVNGRLR
jgi:hypothetical protein